MAIYTGSNKHLGGTETVTRKQTVFYGLVQKNVLVTGANGQLGQELKQLAEKTNSPFRFIYTDADVLDITDAGQVQHFVSELSTSLTVQPIRLWIRLKPMRKWRTGSIAPVRKTWPGRVQK